MAKVQNILLRGQEVVLSTEVVQFDEEGIAEVQSEEVYKGVLELKNFFAVEEEVKEEVKEEPKEEVKEEEKPKAKTATKTVAKK